MQGNAVFTARDVVRQPAFEEAAAAIFGDPRQADDALIGLEFTIAREPVGHAVVLPGTSPQLYALKSRPAPAWPAFVLFYTCDATKVYFEDIIRAQADGDD